MAIQPPGSSFVQPPQPPQPPSPAQKIRRLMDVLNKYRKAGFPETLEGQPEDLHVVLEKLENIVGKFTYGPPSLLKLAAQRAIANIEELQTVLEEKGLPVNDPLPYNLTEDLNTILQSIDPQPPSN